MHKQKGVIEIVLAVLFVAVALFAPTPFYQGQALCEANQIDCPKEGWRFGPSLFQKLLWKITRPEQSTTTSVEKPIVSPIETPMSSSNKDFPEQEKICESLSKTECFVNNNCQGIYGPSICTPGGVCTKDMVFQACGPSGLNTKEIEQIKNECESISGEFSKDGFVGFQCLCEKPNYIGRDRCLKDLITDFQTN